MKYKHKWIIQKISAIIFAITLILTIINFKEIDLFDHSSVITFFESKLICLSKSLILAQFFDKLITLISFMLLFSLL